MENGIRFKDPVCGMTVTPKSFHQLEHAGQRHYFCGAQCKARFEAHLQRYARADATPDFQSPVLQRWPLALRYGLPLALVTVLLLGLLLAAR